jgi:hypothetical protein
LKWVTRALKALVFCLATVALSPVIACGPSALPPAKPAPQADIETRVTPLKQPRELPRLLAPPPAYGNKIVMAQVTRRESQN